MKRTVAVLFSALLLCGVVACNCDTKTATEKEIKLDKAIIKTGKATTNFEGIGIKIVSAVWNDKEIKISVNWINKTDYDITYGDSYDIERENSGKWRSCVSIDNLAFNAIGYELKSGNTQNKTYYLTDTFDISENGNYRIKSDCLVYDKGRGGESTKCELWAEFSVTRVGDTGNDVDKTPVAFVPRYVRTDGYHDGIKYPVVKIIRSVKELNEYYQANKSLYDLERRKNPASDNTIGFLDACDEYNEAYFKEQILVMVLLEEGSGSVRHNVDGVKTGSDGKLYVSVRTVAPEVGTADIAEWHILIEPEKGVNVRSEADVTVLIDGINTKTLPTTVCEAGDYSNIALTIPYDWKYETERNDDSKGYCIAFWPANQAEGKIRVWHYNNFGVCGTGLKQETITVGDYKARKGTYDNQKLWDFISFIGVPGYYVVINENADKWWNKYGDDAMQILGTVKIGEGIITEEQAVKIAKKRVSADYNNTTAMFDAEKGLWTVSFSKKNASGVNQVFYVSHDGKVIDT